jgi:hypothetical protein
MTNQIVELKDSKRHPSALLVYLILEEEGRLQPLSRAKIAHDVAATFGVDLSLKTISDAATVLKSLSLGEHPLLDFHQRGKLGYQLGNLKSPLSSEELATLLCYFLNLSSQAANHFEASLRPYLKPEDAAMLEGLTPHLPPSRHSCKMGDTLTPYYQNLRTILTALKDGKEIRFDHALISAPNPEIVSPKEVLLVPYDLFMKNGRFYLLGGVLGLIDTPNGKKPGLYIAAIESMHHVSLSGNEAADLPIKNCLQGPRFRLGDYLASVFFIQEGPLRPYSLLSHRLVITSDWAYQLSLAMFGENVSLLEKNLLPPDIEHPSSRTEYVVRLHLDDSAYMMWALYFAGHYRFDSPFEQRETSPFRLALRAKVAQLEKIFG